MAVGSPMQFRADLAAFAKKLEVDVTLVRKKVTFDVFERIVSRTPVSTGRARMSWNVTDELPDLQPEPEVASDPESAKAFALGKLARLQFTQPYSTNYIANGLPYIMRLEHGHSKQAPAGMVRLAISEVEAGILAAGGSLRDGI